MLLDTNVGSRDGNTLGNNDGLALELILGETEGIEDGLLLL